MAGGCVYFVIRDATRKILAIHKTRDSAIACFKVYEDAKDMFFPLTLVQVATDEYGRVVAEQMLDALTRKPIVV
jgi:DNA-binding LacI/PurR family transcriptional regulator